MAARSPILTVTLSVLSLVAASSAPRAADLTLDGVQQVYKTQGGSLAVDLTGAPGALAFLLLDLAPGPGTLGVHSVPLGVSGAFTIVELGFVPGGGSLSLTTTLPVNPAFEDQSVYAVAVLAGGGPLDFSPGARVTFVERDVDLAGNPLGQAPFFEYVRAFNAGAPIEVSVDPRRFPQAVGVTADVYVVAAREAAGWDADPTLIDVTANGVESVTFGAALLDNLLEVDAGSLSANAGGGLGVGYDVVVDLDRDGQLGPDDLIDGYGDEAGLYVVHDTTLPGPHGVIETLYSGGTFLGQDLYYPADVAGMGELPVIVVSHGNGHNYQWYDHIGMHMASYGFIVMSHQNNTVPGIETASTTTLTNTDYLLGNLDIIAGGALQGHVDTDNIAWIGHSRGGEGVARAYDRLFDGSYTPANFDLGDIVFVSSIAPTDFLGTNSATPHDVPYHLWVGGADADVTGCANNDIAQSFHLLDRASAQRSSISLHGVGHGDFHASTGSVATGPCLVGKSNTHTIMRGYMLPLFLYHQKGNLPAADFLWRQYEGFHPIGAPVSSGCVVVDLQYQQGAGSGAFVIDDVQDGAGNLALSSSGGAVAGSVQNRTEGRLDDENSDFTATTQPFNGFTQGRSTDTSRGMVFEWRGIGTDSLRFDVVPAARNARPWDYLSLRAAQASRHGLTTAALEDLRFTVTLVDHMGAEASIRIDAWGGGIEEPYQRTSCGSGTGWGNEFETVRIALRDFEAQGSDLDLGNLAAVRLDFGPAAGSPVGRLGIDDLQFGVR